jgi:hypothetical protein
VHAAKESFDGLIFDKGVTQFDKGLETFIQNHYPKMPVLPNSRKDRWLVLVPLKIDDNNLGRLDRVIRGL